MEAMTAASVAALTIYDMTKALDKATRFEKFIFGKERREIGAFSVVASPDHCWHFNRQRFGL